METVLNDWAGWLLVPVSFLVLVAFPEVRKAPKLLFSASALLFLQHLVNFVNVNIFTLQGLDADALDFHRDAIAWVENDQWSFQVGARLYEEILAFVYKCLGPSQFLGAELSILACAVGFGVLICLIRQLGLERFRLPLLLMVGILPSRFILCSATLREPYQILFFLLTVYWGLRFRAEKRIFQAASCCLSAAGLGLFHHGLALYVFFLLPCLFLWPAKSGDTLARRKRVRLAFVGLSAVLVVSYGLVLVGGGDGLETLQAVWSGDAIKYAQDYRYRLITLHQGAADYGVPLEASSATGFLVSNIKIYLFYLFAPFPWQVTRLIDWYGLCEALFRVGLLAFSAVQIARSRGGQRHTYILLLLIYFSMTYLWALGTANYGGSIRHHLLTNWILVIVGGPGLFLAAKDGIKRVRHHWGARR